MDPTPLLSALLAHCRRRPAPFHMPGHKGRLEGLQALAPTAALDVTELADTGDLYAGGDVIAQAEALWAAAWSMSACQFLTCGSTQGLHAALLLCARQMGRRVLVDRCCHRSVYNALGLLDLEPVYLPRTQDVPISPAAVAAALTEAEAAGKPLKTVCITSPTYYGVLSDIEAISQLCAAHGAALVVDAAHGAHLPFLGSAAPFRGASLVVASAHKTLPVYGQGALLFAGDGLFDAPSLAWAASVCGTSSPSYVVMASMDYARAWAESGEGRASLAWAAEETAGLRRDFPALRGPGLDPTRLTLTLGNGGGAAAKARLEALGVLPEMADRDHLVFLLSGSNTKEDVARLRRGLEALEAEFSGIYGPAPPPLPPPAPEVVLGPREALLARTRRQSLARSVGCIAGEQVAPYPPGIPVIAPGERITKKCLAYLEKVGYNVEKDVNVLTMDRGEETG